MTANIGLLSWWGGRRPSPSRPADHRGLGLADGRRRMTIYLRRALVLRSPFDRGSGRELSRSQTCPRSGGSTSAAVCAPSLMEQTTGSLRVGRIAARTRPRCARLSRRQADQQCPGQCVVQCSLLSLATTPTSIASRPAWCPLGRESDIQRRLLTEPPAASSGDRRAHSIGALLRMETPLLLVLYSTSAVEHRELLGILGELCSRR